MARFFPLALLACALLAGPFAGAAAPAEPTRLTVYTAIEPELLSLYADAFTKANPGISIRWVRDSGGPIAARLLAEKDAPRADVVFGVALSGLLPLEEHGILEPYRPRGVEDLSPGLYDAREKPVWVGINSWGSAICVNTRELEKKKLPMPASWADLADPRYKGFIAMGSPVSSSTMYMNVASWLQNMGGEKAWAYMEALHKNIRMYTHSGCKPAQMAAQGEIPIAVASAACAQPYVERKAPLVLVVPAEGTGWDVEACALVKGGRNAEAAKKLLDFASSPEVARIALSKAYIPARADALTPEAKKELAAFLPTDRAGAAEKRAETLAEWRKRFDAGR